MKLRQSAVICGSLLGGLRIEASSPRIRLEAVRRLQRGNRAMASVSVSISAPVGIRNGQTVMPNQTRDLNTVTGLLDRIPVSKGGSAEIGGVWSTDRNALITEIAAQITVFQTVNQRKVIDGVIDPRGGTLQLMN